MFCNFIKMGLDVDLFYLFCQGFCYASCVLGLMFLINNNNRKKINEKIFSFCIFEYYLYIILFILYYWNP